MAILGVAPDGQDYLSRFSPDDGPPYIVIILTIVIFQQIYRVSLKKVCFFEICT